MTQYPNNNLFIRKADNSNYWEAGYCIAKNVNKYVPQWERVVLHQFPSYEKAQEWLDNLSYLSATQAQEKENHVF